MTWYMGMEADGPMFDWQDKSGFYADEKTPLPFGVWTPSPTITDISNIPTVAVQIDDRELPDVFQIANAGVVSARFKAIVEAVEPGVHQFFPVELRRKDGRPHEGDYFIFHLTQNVPCVLPSKSGISAIRTVKFDPRTGLPHYHVHEDEYASSRAAYGDRKVFGSLFVMNDGLLVADELIERIQAEKLTNFRLYPVRELDEPFVFVRPVRHGRCRSKPFAAAHKSNIGENEQYGARS